MSNQSRRLGLTVLCLSLVGVLGCHSGAEPAATSVVLPVGDHEAGRRVFMSLGCALCHAAAGDQGIPKTVASAPGPMLGSQQAGKTTASLVDSILNPSHRLPESMADQVVSPMPDYADITVRQLSDVVAYVRYLSE